MSELRIGILGCGNISATHADAIKSATGATLGAVCDIDPAKASKLAEAEGVSAFDDFSEFVEEVDIVNICLPSGMHSDYAIRCARLGKHVLSEKPVDITLKNGIAMVEACEESGVKLGCISQHRFANDMRRAKEAATSGELGKLVEGDAYIKWYRSQAYYDSAGWRGTWEMDGGGCLMNQGVHYVDMIQWIMGGVKSVQARTRTAMHRISVEDQAMAIVEYHNGALGVIQGSTATYPGISERVEIHGTQGSIVIEGDRAKIWSIKDIEEHEAFGAMIAIGREQNLPDDPSSQWHTQHRAQVQDFVDAVVEDRQPFLTGREALEPLKVILAIYESAKRGGSSVELAELTP